MDRLEQEKRIIARTSAATVALNALLAVMKIVTGILGRSTALISDAINSISDVLTTIVVWITGRFSRKEMDDDHPYGHEKYESMVSVFLGFALMLTAFEIAKSAGGSLVAYFLRGEAIEAPNVIALIAAGMTIAVKAVMAFFTKRNAKRASSPALQALAMDHMSDQIAALGVVIGVGGAMLGIVFLEPIASLFICVLIVKMAFRIIKIGFAQVVDQAADQASRERIIQIAEGFEGVVRIDDIKTRMFGMRMFVDMEIAVDHTLQMTVAHDIAQRLHDAIEEAMPDVKHCMIHVNPDIECTNP